MLHKYNSMNTQLITKQFQTMDINMIQDDDKEVWFKRS
jgi:hypothetical protein